MPDIGISNRLRLAGLFVVAVCAILLFNPGAKGLFTDISTLFLLAIGIFVAAEFAPYIKSIKAGGVEITLEKELTNKLAEVEGKVALLEVKQAGGVAGSTAELQDSREITELSSELADKAPAFTEKRRVIRRNDKNFSRFGQKAEVGDYALTANFKQLSDRFVEINLEVKHRTGALPRGAYAIFYLHETFKPDKQFRLFDSEGAARLSVISYGGFTVGVWVPHAKVELELDLTNLPNAPDIIRFR